VDLVPLVKHFEGLHRVVRRTPAISVAPYICPAGYWTIGYGHVCRQDHPEISEPVAESLLHSDLLMARGQTLALTRWPLQAPQIDALTSFVFNLGISRYRGSTLRAVINRGELDRVPGELRRWVFGGGKRLAGLVLRREAEIELFGMT
jgi:lysozyme